MAEERQILLELEVDKQGAQTALESTSAQLEINKKELKELNQEYKEGTLSVQEYSKKKLQLTQSNKELKTEQRQLIKTLDAEDNSLNALRANLSKLTKERNNVNTSTEKGQARFKELQEQILTTTDAIKEQEEAGGDFRRSVGNYGKALSSNIPLLDGYVQQLQSFKAGLIATKNGLNLTTKGLNGSQKALKLFKIALASTGIGLIVVALGSLVTFLTSTQRGMDAVTKVTRPLSQIFERLVGVVQDLGGKAFDQLGKAIDNPIEALKNLGDIIVNNIINRFQSLAVFGEAISELFSGNFSNAAKLAADASIQFATGIENGTDKIKGAIDATVEFTNNAIDAGLTIDELTKSIELQEIALIKLAGANERIFEQQKEIAENQENNLRDRIKAAREALRATTELEQARIDQLDRQIQLKKLENEANDTSREDLKELAELEAQRDEAAAQAAGKRTGVQNLLNTLLKEQNAIAEEALEQERARVEQENIPQLEARKRIEAKELEVQEIKKLTFDSEQAQIDAQRAITDSVREQSEIRTEIRKLETENYLLATGNLLGSLSGLFEQNSAAFRATASLEAAISTYLAINKTLSAFAGVPIPGYALIQAAAIGVQGFANVAKINGLIGGGGASGSTGRSGVSTSAPRAERTTLSGAFDRNQLTGNANAQQQQTNQITNNLRNMPAPVVRVSDINKTQSKTNQVKVTQSL